MEEAVRPRVARWYFDFISPFAYLQWQAVKRMDGVTIDCRPILFAGLLRHHGHKGPAEIAPKRTFTYRHVQWRADRAGVPLTFPPAHPFNPLPVLRLCVAAGATHAAVDAIFDHVWREGRAGDDAAALTGLATRLGIADPEAAMADDTVKKALRANFDAAIADGVFGVPSLVVDGEVFWGEDATAMFQAYLADPHLFDTPAMRRLEALPVGVER
ncbi:2-hydroxychromene-2-carboxylate isomerase [Luteimonas sp. MC1572]|uniref:2-hydroxychromene-2-carboxylate isomerase n=1 Tax=Luteimonas sp. MC1572 TaxID=2799325 RepID=UPI0018F0E980|nr:2-hydroxychromene-2-carboxylate isomerase [Luteimonas sp. MC1572]MBJ6982282.1 2-hydroxychromene-2-carboxylate isomerase [Luteimonas sp. MC1572]QQO03554.1 2-hydroxychromene-2-carboxylate isomerase [Luteimonas sp. MC1572]